MPNWVKVSERLPEDFEEVLTKNNGSFAKAIFVLDEAGVPTFINFSRNWKSRILSNVTEWSRTIEHFNIRKAI